VLDKESMSEKFAKLSLDVVGFSERDLVKFRRYITEPYGMVLVTDRLVRARRLRCMRR
jgi:type IV pilus assembly protein PilB